MIRILIADEPGSIIITIDGRLIGEYVEEIEASVRRVLERQKNVRLFLRNIVHMDEAGRALLSRLAAQSVQLTASGIYSSYVVAQIVS